MAGRRGGVVNAICALFLVGLAVVLASGAAGAAERWAEDDPGTWVFRPGRDTYSDEALLDLRGLNEDYAGQHGFIRLSEDGREFVRGDGEPIRFWAVNSYVWRKGRVALADNARFLAKRGVNMVRWHGNVSAGEGSELTDFDRKKVDQLWQYVAAMKQEGIYMTISPYYPHATRVRDSWGIESEQGNMTCLVFFDPRVQAAYKGWLRAVFGPENPYTGVPLSREPAVAVIQIQNEDSMLFWTIADVTGAERALLRRQFAEWLAEKYGSLEGALEAWDGAAHEKDAPADGQMGLHHIWEMTRDAVRQHGPHSPGMDRRLADQLEFYTMTMRSWFEEVERFLREELGCRQVVNAGNWRPADLVTLNDAERLSYTANQVSGVNRYYTGGLHDGPHQGWAIVNGDRFSNRSVLLDPRELPTNLKLTAGHPMIIPESLWVPPLGYQGEGPFLVSVFQSLCGADAFYWFAMGEAQWRQPASANGFLPSIGKWVCHTPEIMGNFPAAALLYRRGYVERARPVVQEHRTLKEIWRREMPLISEDPGYDPNRAVSEGAADEATAVSPLAFLVGPVEVTYDTEPAEDRVADLDGYIDEESRVVKSITGQVAWDYGRGVCAVNAPAAQGAAGFLRGAGRIELADVVIECGNEYATVLVVSMDGRPLAASQRVLVQAGTIARPTGWKQKPVTWEDDAGNQHKGYEVVNYGQAPWRLINNDLRVGLANPELGSAVALDPNGMPGEKVPLEEESDRRWVRMPPDTKYVVLRP